MPTRSVYNFRIQLRAMVCLPLTHAWISACLAPIWRTAPSAAIPRVSATFLSSKSSSERERPLKYAPTAWYSEWLVYACMFQRLLFVGHMRLSLTSCRVPFMQPGCLASIAHNIIDQFVLQLTHFISISFLAGSDIRNSIRLV